MTNLNGRTAEAGVRLTGQASPRVLYSLSFSAFRLSGSQNIERLPSVATGLNRGIAAAGLAYRLDSKTWLNLDVTGAVSRLSAPVNAYPAGWIHAVSFHGAAQRDLWRGLFVNASLLGIAGTTWWQANRFAEFGAGYRFNRSLTVQYLHSTDYGYTSGGHSVLIRYNFRIGE
jgi:hypothetical protein